MYNHIKTQYKDQHGRHLRQGALLVTAEFLNQLVAGMENITQEMLDEALAGKADADHDHEIGDIETLVAVLADLNSEISGKANLEHEHAIQEIAGLPARLSVFPEDYGAAGTGLVDDAAALQSALNYVGGLGGGIVSLAPGKKYLIDSADLVIPEGVCLMGAGYPGGKRDNSDYTQMPGLILNPARTIKLRKHSEIARVCIRRKGMTAPQTWREAVQEVANFAGTAIVIGDLGGGYITEDAAVRDAFIIGFNLAINANNCGRTVFQNIYGDNINGLRLDNVKDTARVDSVHFWPFLNATRSWSWSTYSVTGCVNNGAGLIRVTCPGHPFITGDTARINYVTGTTEANGRWTVTVIDDSTFDLQGSAFASAYVSGGVVTAWAGGRNGTAFYVGASDGMHLSKLVAFGYDVGFHVSNGANATLFSDAAFDYNPSWGDNKAVGILCDGGSFNTRFVSGFVNGGGYGFVGNSNRGEVISIYGMSISANVRVAELNRGSCLLDGCYLKGECHIGAAGQQMRVISSDTYNATFTGATPTAATKFVFVGDRYTGATARIAGEIVNIGLSEGGQPSGMRTRIHISEGADVRIRRRNNSIGGALAFDRPDGSSGYRLGHVGETDLLIGPVGAEPCRVVIGPRNPTATAYHELTLAANPATPEAGEFYALRVTSKDASGALATFGSIAVAATDITAGAAKGAVVIRVRAGAAGLQTSLTLTGDHVMQHGPSQRTIVDENSHLRLRQYTVAALPSASPAGQMIYVSDLTGGAEPCFADGTNWRRMSDRTVAS